MRVLFSALLLVAALATAHGAGAPSPEASEVRTPAAVTALVARADALLAMDGHAPVREVVNIFRTGYLNTWLKRFREGKNPGAKERARRYDILEAHIARAEQALDWPVPDPVDIPRATSAVVIDGRLDDAAWRTALRIEGAYAFDKHEHLAEPATSWWMLWDAERLYFAFDCADTNIVSAVRERDGAVYTGDCVEMFLLPDPRFHVYWELVIGPSGSIFDAVHYKRWQEVGSIGDVAENMEGLEFAITRRGTLNQQDDRDEGYTVEVAVPFDQLPGYTRSPARVGDTVHFMLARLDRSGETLQPYAPYPLIFWGHNIWNHVRGRLSN